MEEQDREQVARRSTRSREGSRWGARVTPQTKEWLADMAAEQGVTIGRIIEELVASFIGER